MRLLYRYMIVFCLFFFITLPCIYLINIIHRYSIFNRSEVQKRYIIRVGDVSVSKTKEDCRFHSCFDVLQCQPNNAWQIKVYTYPKETYLSPKLKPIFPHLSYEYECIIEALRSSKYATTNASEACLFVPSIDLLSEKGLDFEKVSTALNSLPYWEQGSNHLIFSYFPLHPLPTGAPMNIQIGHAFVATSNLLSSNYRQGFDISIPLFNSLTAVNPDTHVISMNGLRRFKLIVSQLSVLVKQRNIVRKLENDDPDVLLLRKCLNSPVNAFHYKTLCKDGTAFSYPTVLREGTFCLILPSRYYGSTILLDALMMGCVPVLIMDDYILPFGDVIDWKLAAVQLREYQLQDVMMLLRKLTDEEIKEKRYYAFYFWKRYFSSIRKIVETTLDLINERVFVHKRKSYEEWNGPFGAIDGFYKQPGATPPLFLPMAPAAESGFTAVILTYNRVEMLFTLMRALEKVQSLAKIIILWNNPYSNPYENEWPIIKKRWKMIRMKTNHLTNRFYPFEDIETEAVMAIDDDILMLTADEIEFAYQTWLEFPDRLVGFPARAHETVSNELINGKFYNYKYASEWRNELTMVLTGAAFYHKVYNHWFTFMLPLKTRNYIDAKMNCEDIGMNFLIANLTGKAAIKVTPRKRFKCAQCSGNDSLWSESSHFVKRSECLSVFTKHFGKMPLEPVEFRVDPVLFQEEVPLEIKAFPNVGTV